MSMDAEFDTKSQLIKTVHSKQPWTRPPATYSTVSTLPALPRTSQWWLYGGRPFRNWTKQESS
jgi:hypothetical protein